MPTFTVGQILDAAEKNKYKNYNDSWIEYNTKAIKVNGILIDIIEDRSKIVQACVIGEAFLNLGLVENGTDAGDLNEELRYVYPDDRITLRRPDLDWQGLPQTEVFENLSDFINTLNGWNGYRGKKRIVKLARKYFSQSLNHEVTFGVGEQEHEYDRN